MYYQDRNNLRRSLRQSTFSKIQKQPSKLLPRVKNLPATKFLLAYKTLRIFVRKKKNMNFNSYFKPYLKPINECDLILSRKRKLNSTLFIVSCIACIVITIERQLQLSQQRNRRVSDIFTTKYSNEIISISLVYIKIHCLRSTILVSYRYIRVNICLLQVFSLDTNIHFTSTMNLFSNVYA